MYGHPQSQLGTAGISMPRPLQDDLKQESQESRTANTFTSRFAPVGEEPRGTNRLSRTSSVASLPESSSANDSSVENLEIQMNSLIKPLQDQITALTEQSSKLTEENLKFHKLLAEQSSLIERLTKNNEILELRLIEQQKKFDQQLAQERQGIEIATKSMEDFKPQIFSKLKQHQEKLYEELSEQTSKINIDREKLQQDFNSFNVEMTEKEQQHHQEMLMLFKQLEEPLKEQQKKHNDLQENLNKVNHDLNNHWHRHANLKSNLKEYISTKPQFTPMPELCRVQ